MSGGRWRGLDDDLDRNRFRRNHLLRRAPPRQDHAQRQDMKTQRGEERPGEKLRGRAPRADGLRAQNSGPYGGHVEIVRRACRKLRHIGFFEARPFRRTPFSRESRLQPVSSLTTIVLCDVQHNATRLMRRKAGRLPRASVRSLTQNIDRAISNRRDRLVSKRAATPLRKAAAAFQNVARMPA